nr:terminase DNA packaging enzyme small subunit [uncultured Mediterranean phage uvMED]|tara:strand:+ start:7418 stop:7825 length:408 start_codon:yes stop_codon:yes gene_type:complete
MSKNFDELEETFNVEADIVETPEKKLEKIKSTADDIRKDYDYTRGNLYSIIEKGQEALNGALELAQETDSPRAYEVTGQLIKSISDATDKLLDLQKKLKEVEEDKSKGPTNVTNALFVGSTADLAKLLKQQQGNK